MFRLLPVVTMGKFGVKNFDCKIRMVAHYLFL